MRRPPGMPAPETPWLAEAGGPCKLTGTLPNQAAAAKMGVAGVPGCCWEAGQQHRAACAVTATRTAPRVPPSPTWPGSHCLAHERLPADGLELGKNQGGEEGGPQAAGGGADVLNAFLHPGAHHPGPPTREGSPVGQRWQGGGPRSGRAFPAHGPRGARQCAPNARACIFSWMVLHARMHANTQGASRAGHAFTPTCEMLTSAI